MKIISIDPGYERLGIAIIEKDPSTQLRTREVLLFSECFKTSAALPHSERLLILGNRIREIIKEWKPSAMAIETLFFSVNKTSAMKVSEARGVIVYEAMNAGIKVKEFSPADIKIAVTGYGKADKTAVMDMVRKLIKIEKKTTSDDELDAIAAGITFFAHHR
jgi:crossover junction endodeoxyribonuclease RuvC